MKRQEQFNLDMWLEIESRLSIAYYIKEAIFTICEIKTREKAEPLYGTELRVIKWEYQ